MSEMRMSHKLELLPNAVAVDVILATLPTVAWKCCCGQTLGQIPNGKVNNNHNNNEFLKRA